MNVLNLDDEDAAIIRVGEWFVSGLLCKEYVDLPFLPPKAILHCKLVIGKIVAVLAVPSADGGDKQEVCGCISCHF